MPQNLVRLLLSAFLLSSKLFSVPIPGARTLEDLLQNPTAKLGGATLLFDSLRNDPFLRSQYALSVSRSSTLTNMAAFGASQRAAFGARIKRDFGLGNLRDSWLVNPLGQIRTSLELLNLQLFNVFEFQDPDSFWQAQYAFDLVKGSLVLDATTPTKLAALDHSAYVVWAQLRKAKIAPPVRLPLMSPETIRARVEAWRKKNIEKLQETQGQIFRVLRILIGEYFPKTVIEIGKDKLPGSQFPHVPPIEYQRVEDVGSLAFNWNAAPSVVRIPKALKAGFFRFSNYWVPLPFRFQQVLNEVDFSLFERSHLNFKLRFWYFAPFTRGGFSTFSDFYGTSAAVFKGRTLVNDSGVLTNLSLINQLSLQGKDRLPWWVQVYLHFLAEADLEAQFFEALLSHLDFGKPLALPKKLRELSLAAQLHAQLPPRLSLYLDRVRNGDLEGPGDLLGDIEWARLSFNRSAWEERDLEAKGNGFESIQDVLKADQGVFSTRGVKKPDFSNYGKTVYVSKGDVRNLRKIVDLDLDWFVSRPAKSLFVTFDELPDSEHSELQHVSLVRPKPIEVRIKKRELVSVAGGHRANPIPTPDEGVIASVDLTTPTGDRLLEGKHYRVQFHPGTESYYYFFNESQVANDFGRSVRLKLEAGFSFVKKKLPEVRFPEQQIARLNLLARELDLKWLERELGKIGNTPTTTQVLTAFQDSGLYSFREPQSLSPQMRENLSRVSVSPELEDVLCYVHKGRLYATCGQSNFFLAACVNWAGSDPSMCLSAVNQGGYLTHFGAKTVTHDRAHLRTVLYRDGVRIPVDGTPWKKPFWEDLRSLWSSLFALGSTDSTPAYEEPFSLTKSIFNRKAWLSGLAAGALAVGAKEVLGTNIPPNRRIPNEERSVTKPFKEQPMPPSKQKPKKKLDLFLGNKKARRPEEKTSKKEPGDGNTLEVGKVSSPDAFSESTFSPPVPKKEVWVDPMSLVGLQNLRAEVFSVIKKLKLESIRSKFKTPVQKILYVLRLVESYIRDGAVSEEAQISEVTWEHIQEEFAPFLMLLERPNDAFSARAKIDEGRFNAAWKQQLEWYQREAQTKYHPEVFSFFDEEIRDISRRALQKLLETDWLEEKKIAHKTRCVDALRRTP